MLIISPLQEFIQSVFCFDHKPDYIFFDNNCRLALFVRDNDFFNDIGLPVDVFHFGCKHSANNEFCDDNCNPKNFPDLTDENGEWVFNSSVCEQTNVWVGGFFAICREMGPVRYNFFLDEMIIERNEVFLARLERGGAFPGYWAAAD